ncbi:MAG: CBS domain-containing protein [Balneolaceae bacterium]|nr:CBS domain-containing protein [Balneolaceae bacterium]
MLVHEILTSKGNEVFSIKPDNTVYEAIEKMADKNIGALLVMDQGKLKGIISERDYRNKVILKGRRSKTTEVREIMTPGVYCVAPDQSIEQCMAVMTEKKIRHLPVMKGDEVVGVISIGDLVKSIISQQKVEINNLKEYITGTYPG